MQYRKYSFETEAAFNKAIEALKIEPIEGVEQPQIKFTFIPITCIQTPAVLDSKGKVKKEAVIDPNYNVDVIWEGEEPTEFIPFQVWPHNIGQHIVGGWEEQYAIDRENALEAAALPEPKTKKSKLK
jgi:hypothetical protein